jgi:peptidoglycan/LPS O-acetylase OafA/YrhL
MGYLIMQLNTRYLVKEAKWTAVTCISAFVSVVVIVSLSPSLENWHRSLLAFVIVIAISYATILRRVFSNALLLFIGKISFTLYLIQFTIICTLSAYLATQFRDHDYVNAISANLNLVITVALCIAVAYVLNPIDVYSIRFAKKISSLSFKKNVLLTLLNNLFFKEDAHEKTTNSFALTTNITLSLGSIQHRSIRA